MTGMRSRLAGAPLLFSLASITLAPPVWSFCGFYAGRGDTRIYNNASKVVVARDGDRTVITMASDFHGNAKDFAVVVPVPTVLQRGQVHIGDSAAVNHLDEYSAPRLAEYWDENPCPRRVELHAEALRLGPGLVSASLSSVKVDASVKIRAQYKVDEYDIVILSATQGQSLATWLTEHGYTIPNGAEDVLASYIKQGMYFFVAKVDVAEQQRRGFAYLRPIQVAFESSKFMLPIRLGMANAAGPQEMFVFFLTRRGRVETTNYRTVRLPTDLEVPEMVKAEFPEFTRRVFDIQHHEHQRRAVFLEYAWTVEPNTQKCDPCSAPVLRPNELRELGAYWISLRSQPPGQAVLTRLHLRYDRHHFPEDLLFHETGDRQNWQVRYVIRHPYRGTETCPEIQAYWEKLRDRRRKEAATYAELTRQPAERVRQRMGLAEDWSDPDEQLNWWDRIWKR